MGQLTGLCELPLETLACLHKVLDQGGLFDIVSVLFAGSIFALRGRSPKTAGTAWFHPVALDFAFVAV